MADETEHEEVSVVIQDAVERDLNPVRFGLVERAMFLVTLVLAVISAAFSLLVLVLTY